MTARAKPGPRKAALDDTGLTEGDVDFIIRQFKNGIIPSNSDAMGLLKKGNFVLEREHDGTHAVTLFAHPWRKSGATTVHVARNDPDLNHAIAECIAKMREMKRNYRREQERIYERMQEQKGKR